MTLYIVATPIGNLEDMTFRALRILKEVDLIACEDTRQTSKLLNHYGFKNQLTSYNDFNKTRKTKLLINELKQGKNIAIVSDSGTPGVNDPGFYIVRECIRENIDVVPVPGACAMINALVCSGLPTDSFAFYGFFPKKDGKKKKAIEIIKNIKQTAIFYESPHRIQKTLKLFAELIPEKNLVLARELTKKFEEFIRGTAKDVYEKCNDKTIKGEIVLLIS